jgi:hypothetical protein
MQIDLRVSFINGQTADVDAVFADFIAFEKERRRSVVRLDADMQLTDLAWLAWHAEKRLGKTALKFEPDWVSTVKSVEVRNDSEGTAPLDSASK